MAVAIITGSSGLIGSEAARTFRSNGLDVVGIDNNLREYFFGADGSTGWNADSLKRELGAGFTHEAIDVRDETAVRRVFQRHGKSVTAVVHAAAQPSHDWAAREPITDFSVNAVGTLTMLECTRMYAPGAAFLFTSTNKVYGDTPNRLPLVEKGTRWELAESHPYCAFGVDESMSIDQSTHSLFGASKVAADILVQEYARSFGLRTGVFRAGCLTGPAHSGAELQGFLAYLAKCAVSGRSYTIYGHKGKQVRDNLHSRDFVSALWRFFERPMPGSVYNLGGSRANDCSILEAIAIAEEISGRKFNYNVTERARLGDHIWWVSDVRKFQRDYPGWSPVSSIRDILSENVAAASERLSGATVQS